MKGKHLFLLILVTLILIILILSFPYNKLLFEYFNSPITKHITLDDSSNVSNSGIPLIIHQTWKTKNLTGKFKMGVESWKLKNPEFQHYLYDDEDCLNFIRNNYNRYLNFYKLLTPVQKADIFRYLIIHKYGGVYTDIDTVCLNNIKEVLVKPMVIGIEYLPEHNNGKMQYNQWFFASVPNNPIFIDIVDEIVKRKNLLLENKKYFNNKNQETYWLTGPLIFTEYVSKLDPKSIKIFNRCAFGSFDDRCKQNNKDKIYLIHGFEGSWKDNWNKQKW